MTEILQELPNYARLSTRVIRILGFNPGKFTLQGTNTYLIGTGTQRILLDTGEGKPEYRNLLEDSLIKDGNIRISDILISHWHPDHVGGIDDIFQLSHKNSLSPPKVHKILDPSHDKPEHSFLQPVKDNQIFQTEGATLRAIATPGHSQDHLAFFLEEENALFSADCVLGQGTVVFEDLGKYMASLYKLKNLKPGRIYPGHGSIVEDGMATLEQYIHHRLVREEQILLILKNTKDRGWSITPREIVGILYAKHPESIWLAAERGVILHLIKLESDGKVKKPVDSNYKDLKSLRGPWTYVDKPKIISGLD
ncbi:hypothetical protein G9A89_020303 [Geosiphon pyriformis]|nr:hypothetical protein G9A89_020303 [Geosiphon pyriformis]